MCFTELVKVVRFLRLHYTRLFPDSRFFLFVLQNIVGYKNDIKGGWMSASMKWRHLGHLQILSRVVVAMAEMEVNPHEEMANSQGMKCSPLRNMGILKISCLFLLCVECNRRHSYLCRIGQLSRVRCSGKHRQRLCGSGLRSPDLSAKVRPPDT